MNPDITALRQRVTTQRKIDAEKCRRKNPTKRKANKTMQRFTDGLNCYICGKRLTRANATIDHIHPLARGGLDIESNKAWACVGCNREKGTLLLGEYLQKYKFKREESNI